MSRIAVAVHQKRSTLTILLAVCEVARASGLLGRELEEDVASVIQRTEAELEALPGAAVDGSGDGVGPP